MEDEVDLHGTVDQERSQCANCLSKKSKPVSDMVLTVEPGIYLKDRFGVRIEDTVIVTRSGCENITKATKEPMVVG